MATTKFMMKTRDSLLQQFGQDVMSSGLAKYHLKRKTLIGQSTSQLSSSKIRKTPLKTGGS